MTTESSNSNHESDVKTFTFRALDPMLHTTWKTCAAMSGISMEEFGVKAIRALIKKELSKNSPLDPEEEES